MSRRADILAEFTTWLSTVGPVFRGYKYTDNINEFPTICYTVTNDYTYHVSDNIRYSVMTLSLRGYVRGEDSMGLADQLLLDLDERISSFVSSAYSTVDSRVLSCKTDEGTLNPLGVAEIEISLGYQHDITV